MGNVDNHRSAHEAFNRRDFNEAVRNFHDDLHYTDHPRNLTTKGPAEFINWMQGWVTAFSDAQVTEARYIDGGDHSVCIFQGRGTNDGSMGPQPATGKRMDMAYCEIFRYDAEGRTVAGEMFYDTMTMLAQLGIQEPPPTG